MKDITDRLKRWSEIAQLTSEKKEWSKCSLLHSFGDKLSRYLEEAVKLIENLKKINKKEPYSIEHIRNSYLRNLSCTLSEICSPYYF